MAPAVVPKCQPSNGFFNIRGLLVFHRRNTRGLTNGKSYSIIEMYSEEARKVVLATSIWKAFKDS